MKLPVPCKSSMETDLVRALVPSAQAGGFIGFTAWSGDLLKLSNVL